MNSNDALKLKLTPWSRVHLENLVGDKIVKKFPALCGT
jgi:hypothetical protein